MQISQINLANTVPTTYKLMKFSLAPALNLKSNKIKALLTIPLIKVRASLITADVSIHLRVLFQNFSQLIHRVYIKSTSL